MDILFGRGRSEHTVAASHVLDRGCLNIIPIVDFFVIPSKVDRFAPLSLSTTQILPACSLA